MFVDSMFTLNATHYDRFKLNLRDFLIQLKEFSGSDNAELFAEEKEQQERELKAAEHERLSKVGGLLKPELLEDDDELWLNEELKNEKSNRSTNLGNPTEYRPLLVAHELDWWGLYEVWILISLPSRLPGYTLPICFLLSIWYH